MMTKKDHDCCSCRKKAKEISDYLIEYDEVEKFKKVCERYQSTKRDLRDTSTRWTL